MLLLESQSLQNKGHEMNRKRFWIITISCLIVAFLFIPYQTVLVPTWRLRVVDENGNPYKGQWIKQICHHYTFDVEPCAEGESQYTDENGYVEFPERSFSMGLLHRIVVGAKNYLTLIPHGGVGPRIYLMSIDYPAGSATLNYDWGSGSLPEQWIISSKNAYRPSGADE